MGTARWLCSAARAVARVVVPVACPGCGLEDVLWCDECAAPWWAEPCRSESGAGRLDVLGRLPLPVWSIAPLEGSNHRMIAAWKDGKRRDLDPFFLDAARRAAEALAPTLAVADTVVPIPPHRRSIRARGRDLTKALAVAVGEGLAARGIEVSVERLLENRGVESRALADRERWTNANRGIRGRGSVRNASVAILVDDVVTTGASLARSSEILEERGIAVVGAVTLAATPPPRRSGPPSFRLGSP